MQNSTKFPPTASFSRRRFLTATGGLVGISALAACGMSEQVAAPEETPADTTTAGGTMTTDTAVAETYQVPGFLPYALAPTMLEVVAERDDTVLVRHLYGETAIPQNPERIYADGSTLDIFISLGITPVAANYFYPDDGAPRQITPLLEDVDLYDRGPINLEVVASHNPDLIVVWDVVVTFADDPEELYTLLSDIAPTVVLNENPYSFWQQATRDIATMLDISDRADALIAEFEETTEAECERIRGVIGADETITIVTVNDGALRMMSPGYTTETGYIPLGATQWAYQDCQLLPGPEVVEIVGEDGGPIDISRELIPNLQANHLVVIALNDVDTDFEALVDDPLWQAVPAVQAGTAYAIPQMFSTSYYSALDMLNTVGSVITSAE